jgi:hypothetical protein
MSPLLKHILESKVARRRQLMALPYPEKVRIVEQMRAAALEIKSVDWRVCEEPPQCGVKKP